MQVGFYFDQTRCTGCYTCRVACKDWHDIPAGPENWLRVNVTEKGKFPDIFVSYLVAPCYQCQNPVCIVVCPTRAISKRPGSGIVVVDDSLCIGRKKCREKCLKACPYDAPQFGPEPDARMRKCNFCLDRWLENKMPVCVEACPMRCLDAGPMDELEAKYGKNQVATGFIYSQRTRPSVVFKPKEDKSERKGNA